MTFSGAFIDIGLILLALLAGLSIYYGTKKKLPFSPAKPALKEEDDEPIPLGDLSSPFLTFERVFVREQGEQLRLQLLLKSTGRLLIFQDVVCLEESDLEVQYLPMEEEVKEGSEEYPRGTSLTLFLSGHDLNPRKEPYYDLQITYSDDDGKLFTQRISGLDTYNPIVDPPVLMNPPKAQKIS